MTFSTTGFVRVEATSAPRRLGLRAEESASGE
jgi:hypothetical protein